MIMFETLVESVGLFVPIVVENRSGRTFMFDARRTIGAQREILVGLLRVFKAVHRVGHSRLNTVAIFVSAALSSEIGLMFTIAL